MCWGLQALTSKLHMTRQFLKCTCEICPGVNQNFRVSRENYLKTKGVSYSVMGETTLSEMYLSLPAGGPSQSVCLSRPCLNCVWLAHGNCTSFHDLIMLRRSRS